MPNVVVSHGHFPTCFQYSTAAAVTQKSRLEQKSDVQQLANIYNLTTISKVTTERLVLKRLGPHLLASPVGLSTPSALYFIY